MWDSAGVLAVALFFYTFAAFGLAWIIADSKASRPVRRLVAYFAEHEAASRATRVIASLVLALLECVACLGFWIGLVVGWYLAPALGGTRIVLALSLACYTAGLNFVIGRKTDLL